MSRRMLQCLPVAGAVAVAVGFSAGGWATITVEDLPDSFVAGEAVDLAFQLRAHGTQPLPNRKPIVEWRHGTTVERADARPNGKTGSYAARVTVPAAGEWSITIDADFGESRTTLLPITAADRGAPAPAAPPLHERGRRLFVAKGCVTCHTHASVDGSGSAGVGPDLTAPRYADEYLARLLADPSVLPRRSEWVMPDLELKHREIEALVAFLNRPSGGEN